MNETERHIFSGMQILADHKWIKDHAIVVEGQHIRAIIPNEMIKHHLPAQKHEFPNDHFLVPGFIDLHVHGAKGSDVMDATHEALLTISRTLAAEGVTGFLATTMTAENEQIERVLSLIPEAMVAVDGAAIFGVHLEGPFIAKEKKGAQSGEEVVLPDVALIKQWQKLAQGTIKLVTLAPELKGALELIHALRNMDVIASIGHTNATYDETSAAISAGCSHATHLFNAMRGIHQREPGAAGALLLADDLSVELIVDGIHLHPAMVDLCYRLKAKEHLMLVTDAMRAKCMRNGQYDLGGQLVNVQDGKATLKDGTLAGSTLRMPQAIKNMTAFTNCLLADAIYMASYNPAAKLGLVDRKGSIEVGKDADLVVLKSDLSVLFTMREGQKIFEQTV